MSLVGSRAAVVGVVGVVIRPTGIFLQHSFDSRFAIQVSITVIKVPIRAFMELGARTLAMLVSEATLKILRKSYVGQQRGCIRF